MPRRLYIETVGCQMNVLDSELVAASLLEAGYELIESIGRPTPSLQHLQRAATRRGQDLQCPGRLKQVKQRHPETIIGVLGCMAQKDQQQIFRRAPHVDLVVGPGQLHQIPELLERVAPAAGRKWKSAWTARAAAAAAGRRELRPLRPARATSRARPARHQAMVRIMFGCDKFCTYCIVPSVRGPEQSRPAGEIVGRSANWSTKAAWRSRCWARPSIATATPAVAARIAALRSVGPARTTSTGLRAAASS